MLYVSINSYILSDSEAMKKMAVENAESAYAKHKAKVWLFIF